MPYQFEARIQKKMLYVSFGASEKIVYAEDFMALVDQVIAQVRSQEICAACD
jgi:hypothetical protein